MRELKILSDPFLPAGTVEYRHEDMAYHCSPDTRDNFKQTMGWMEKLRELCRDPVVGPTFASFYRYVQSPLYGRAAVDDWRAFRQTVLNCNMAESIERGY